MNPAPLFNAHHHPWLGGWWWSPSVELPLPELYRRSPRRPRPHAIVRGGERRPGEMGSSQPLARAPGAARRPPPALAPPPPLVAPPLCWAGRRREWRHARAPAAAGWARGASGIRPPGGGRAG